MARISTPEADALLDKPFPVLDHGFVRLVDYLGGDARIVQAARVSYGEGTKTVREDRALIDYLLRHRHTSPFEMVELTFHIKAPIFVVRQWFRHRTACLTGNVKLYFDEPAAIRRGKRKLRKVPIAEFYRKWKQGYTHLSNKRKPLYLERVDPQASYTVSELAALVERRPEDLRNLVRAGRLEAERTATQHPARASIRIRGQSWHAYAQKRFALRKPLRARLEAMHLRRCNEESGEIDHTRVVEIWECGIKPVFRVTLDNGYRTEMTAQHRCLTAQGWMTLQEATGLALHESGNVSWRNDAPAFAVNGEPAYRNRTWLADKKAQGFSIAQMADRAGVSYATIRKYLRVFGLSFSPTERARLSGRAQRGRRRTIRRGPLSAEALSAIRRARSGKNSNFWKGGVSSERSNIARWTKEQAPKVHARHGYRCALCASGKHLQAHHIDPVWHNPAKARDHTNLLSLCRSCHQRVHHRHLELDLLDWTVRGRALEAFWHHHPHRNPHPQNKPHPTPTRLARSYAKVTKIEYIGEQMTYDLEVQGPFHNFVADGFIVHNSVNEVSARYSVMKDEFYLPAPEHIRTQGTVNKQVGEGALAPEASSRARTDIEQAQLQSYATYQHLLELGLARELAREVLPVGLYTEFYWKQDLHNLFHFLRLRLDWHAQYEIRAYGDAIAQIVKAVCPMAYEAFEEHILHGRQFSRLELDALRAALDASKLEALLREAGLRKTRRKECFAKLGLPYPGDEEAADKADQALSP
jgi:thymidylate synthase (FAD)